MGEDCPPPKEEVQEDTDQKEGQLRGISFSPGFEGGRLASYADGWSKCGANGWIVTVVREGFMPHINPYASMIQRMWWDQQFSEEERLWLQKELERLLLLNVIEEGEEVKILSKIRPHPKKQKGQYRLVVDLRGVNQGLSEKPFRMETLPRVLMFIAGKRWGITIDLKEGYYHLLVHPSFRKYLGIKGPDGRIFRFRTLNFGLSQAPWIFTKVIRQVLIILRGRGITCSAYLDDFIVVGDSFEGLQQTLEEEVLPLFSSLGLLINEEKSKLIPSQRVEYLGLVMDLGAGLISIPTQKVKSSRKAIGRIEADFWRGRRSLTLRKIASISGIIVALDPALLQARLFTRSVLGLIREGKELGKRWGQSMELTLEAMKDLLYLKEVIRENVGRPMRTSQRSAVLFVDASRSGWGAVLQDAGTASGRWGEQEQNWHINVLELLAVQLALKSFAWADLGREVHLITDNMVCYYYLRRGGGRNSQMNNIAKGIMLLEISLGVKLLVPVWIPTDLNPADGPSRLVDVDDWKVSELCFQTLISLWLEEGMEVVDRFADSSNTKSARFNSLMHCPGSEGVDAFSQRWATGGVMNWLAPPFRLIPKTLLYLREEEAEGIIIVPSWAAQPWWPLLMDLTVGPPVKLTAEDIKEGPSGVVEPFFNRSWGILACRITGRSYLQGRLD